MEPIATYSEKRFSGKRYFELYPEKVHVQGKVFLQNDFDINIELKKLSPDYQKLRVREKAFWAGIWMVTIPLLLLEILTSVFSVTFANPIIGLMIVFPISGILLCVATFRKVEFYSFSNSSGIAVLDIARAGKDKEKFEAFVEQLIGCIKESKNNARQAGRQMC